MTQVQRPHVISIGNKRVLVEDEDFARSYDKGYETYHRYHHDDEMVDSALLLFQVRNGWNDAHSEMETTAYIMGWLAAFYEQEQGQLAQFVSVMGDCEGVA